MASRNSEDGEKLNKISISKRDYNDSVKRIKSEKG